jgi:DNA-directed RNA polymerase sigma subunit (sigma70/sigma32)
LSLSAAVGEDGTLELGDTIEQDTVPSVERELMRSSFEEQIRSLVAELDEKERQVSSLRGELN